MEVATVDVEVDVERDFESVYKARFGSLVSFFRAKGIGREDAHDLAEETMLRTLVHLRRHGRTENDLGPLTKTIARNLAVERLRKARPEITVLTEAVDVADDAPEPFELAAATERREAVRAALRTLSPRHRKVVGLWMEGLSPGEIAGELGIKRNAVDAVLHRARRALASRLGPRALWGVIGLAWLRARTQVRGAMRNAASFVPNHASSAEAGLSLATVALAAVLTVASPGVSGGAARVDEPTSIASRTTASKVEAPRAVTDEVAASAPAAPKAARAVAAPSVREPRYGVGASTSVPDPATGKNREGGIDITYDPDSGGRGVVDDVLDPVLGEVCEGCRREP